jgi:hypothetical protein
MSQKQLRQLPQVIFKCSLGLERTFFNMTWREWMRCWVSRYDLQRASVKHPGPHPDFRIRNSRGSVSAKSLRTTDLQETLVVTQLTSVYSILKGPSCWGEDKIYWVNQQDPSRWWPSVLKDCLNWSPCLDSFYLHEEIIEVWLLVICWFVSVLKGAAERPGKWGLNQHCAAAVSRKDDQKHGCDTKHYS